MILPDLNFKKPLEFDTSTKFSYNKREKDEKKLQTHHLKISWLIFSFLRKQYLECCALKPEVFMIHFTQFSSLLGI
jgi:hypothetical protein